MKVTISLDFYAIKDDIKNEMINRLIDLKYAEEEIEKLEQSFDENIDGCFMDATFELEEVNGEIVSCMLVGG